MQFKKFLGSIREYKKSSLLSMVLITGEVSMEVALPFLMSLLVDMGLGQQNLGFVLKTGAVMVLVAMVSLIFGIKSGKHAAIASSGFAKNLRKDIYYNIQKFSFTNIDKFSTPSLITRLTTDITNVQNAYQMIIRTAIRAPLMLIFSTIMAMLLNWRLALVFLVSIPLLGGVLFLIVMKAHPIFVKVFKQYDKLNSIVQENINGIRTVKSYVREDYEIEKFHGISKQVLYYFKKAEKILAFNSPAMQFFMFTSILVTQFLGARMIVLQTMTTGELMSLVMYLVQSLSALMMLSMVFVMIIIAQSSAERIVEVLDETSSMQNPENPITVVENGEVVFENVGFRYHGGSEKEILKNVSFAIQSGQTVGILGGTGSAKSTLVQLIPRLYDVTSGQVKVGGLDVRSYDIETLRDAVSMVLQKNVLFSGTIKENLRWGNENATEEEMVNACRQAQADSFIQAMPEGYDTYIERGGSNVSGGQRQRLCIARALLKKPKILILDDSTSAVDTATEAKIRKAFAEELPATTKIIIAQRVSSVEEADQIIVLEDGCINGVGTHAELLQSNDIYREVYESQTRRKAQ